MSPEIIEKMASSCLHQVEMPNVAGRIQIFKWYQLYHIIFKCDVTFMFESEVYTDD